VRPEEQLREVTNGTAGGIALDDKPLKDMRETDGEVLGGV
jgi:hypothetical protein